jgi:hypothetical protein
MTGSGENPQTALDTLTKELLEADCGQMLHPFHHIVFNASLVVMNLSRHTNQHHETVVHAQTAVEGLAAYGLDIYPEAADVYYELAEGLLYKAALVGQPESKGQEEVVESLDPDQMTEAQLDLKEKLLGDALKAYALCKKIRSTCLGVKNTLTKQVIKRMHELNMRPPKN